MILNKSLTNGAILMSIEYFEKHQPSVVYESRKNSQLKIVSSSFVQNGSANEGFIIDCNLLLNNMTFKLIDPIRHQLFGLTVEVYMRA